MFMITNFKIFENKKKFNIGDIVISYENKLYVIISTPIDNISREYRVVQLGIIYNNIVWDDKFFIKHVNGSQLATINYSLQEWSLIELYKELPEELINTIFKKYNIDLNINRNEFFKKNKQKKFNL